MSFAAHLRTVWPVVRRSTAPAPPSETWSAEVADPDMGPVRLTGRLHQLSGPELLILVHGLGGSADSSYMVRTARVAAALGVSTLRLNLRGAGGGGEDLYHAGLSSDLASVLASVERSCFERILMLGFSLGGHLCLRFATEVEDPRLIAVAAACAPLDLDVAVAHIDRPGGWLYRRYVLGNLCRMYAEVAGRRELSLSAGDARRIRKLREWDRRTVVPRFGFDSPEDYYARAGVRRRLDRLRVPALLVAARYDPMVPPAAIDGALAGRPERLTVRWVRRGGHLALPADLDLGEEAPAGLAGQAIGWLRRQG